MNSALFKKNIFVKNDYPQVDFECFKHANDIETSSILIIESLQLMEPTPYKKLDNPLIIVPPL